MSLVDDEERRLWIGLAIAGELAVWLAVVGLLAWLVYRS